MRSGLKRSAPAAAMRSAWIAPGLGWDLGAGWVMGSSRQQFGTRVSTDSPPLLKLSTQTALRDIRGGRQRAPILGSMRPSSHSTRRILVADAAESARGFFVRLLQMAGYDVRFACDGEEAKRILADTSFDVILSDISMPGCSGIDLLKAVRERDLDVPVVLVTGSPSVETAVRAVQ